MEITNNCREIINSSHAVHSLSIPPSFLNSYIVQQFSYFLSLSFHFPFHLHSPVPVLLLIHPFIILPCSFSLPDHSISFFPTLVLHSPYAVHDVPSMISRVQNMTSMSHKAITLKTWIDWPGWAELHSSFPSAEFCRAFWDYRSVTLTKHNTLFVLWDAFHLQSQTHSDFLGVFEQSCHTRTNPRGEEHGGAKVLGREQKKFRQSQP